MTVLPGVSIGKGATVGAGSVVTRNVEPFCVVAGNPARFIRRVEPGVEKAAYEKSIEQASTAPTE